MEIAGIEWDKGNWPKCGKHGVSRLDIEAVLLGTPAISARFMHQKEVEHYERQI